MTKLADKIEALEAEAAELTSGPSVMHLRPDHPDRIAAANRVEAANHLLAKAAALRAREANR